MSDFKVAEFAQVDLVSVANAMRKGLAENFAAVEVDIVPCPDLREIGVASEGMGGETALLEFGGEPYAHNPTYRGTNVNIQAMLDDSGIDNAKVFGAAMADAAAIGDNCGEIISNADPSSENLSRVARVGDDRECIVEEYLAGTCGPIANLFVSEGTPGDVIRIDVRKRTGEQFSLTQSIRESLEPLGSDGRHIGLGGVFELVSGMVRSHVMPNYECLVDGYYDTDQEQVVKDFLQFYEHISVGSKP